MPKETYETKVRVAHTLLAQDKGECPASLSGRLLSHGNKFAVSKTLFLTLNRHCGFFYYVITPDSISKLLFRRTFLT
jgi:hypothetical protein